MPQTLFLGWLDPISCSWFPIGRLTYDGTFYQFVYTQGAKEAQEVCGFRPLSSFPRLDVIYRSTYLFAVFSNRLMAPSRPDYSSFTQWLGLTPHENNPMAILARSGGERETDTLTVFPYPELTKEGYYHLYFFSYGLSNLPQHTIERINRLAYGDKLGLAQDTSSPQVLTLNTKDHDMVGHCPQYLSSEVTARLLKDADEIEVCVERVNQPPAPLQFRLLCRLTVKYSNLFSSPQYQRLEETEPL